MLQELTTYGNTGKESCLDVILRGMSGNVSFGHVPNNVATKVLARCMDVFKSTFLSEKRVRVWNVIMLLCTPEHNTAAEEWMSKLEKTPVLEYAIEACENYPLLDCVISLTFLNLFMETSDHRKDLVMNKSKLLRAMLSLLDACASAADQDWHVHKVVLQVLNVSFWCAVPLDPFLKLGGFAKLSSVLDKLVTKGLAEYHETGKVSDESSFRIIESGCSVCAFQYAAVRKHQQLTQSTLPATLYCYTVAEMQRYTELVNSAFDMAFSDDIRLHISASLTESGNYLLAFTLPDESEKYKTMDFEEARTKFGYHALQYFLLTPGALSGVPLLTKCLRILRAFDNIQGTPTSTWLTELAHFGRLDPIRAAIEAETNESLNFCSLPSCKVSNLVPNSVPARGCLKKCVQCRTAWYCGREHQVAHWPEHKQECKRLAAEALAVEAVDVPAATETAVS